MAGPTATGKRTWLDPAWQADALGWAESDARRAGPARRRPDRATTCASLVDGVPDPDRQGPAWLKASGPGPAYEGPLLEVFAARGVRRVPLPLAVHPDRPWLLLDDAGPTLRQTRPDGTGDRDLAAWERILAEYAELQRSLETERLCRGACSLRAPRTGARRHSPGSWHGCSTRTRGGSA